MRCFWNYPDHDNDIVTMFHKIQVLLAFAIVSDFESVTNFVLLRSLQSFPGNSTQHCIINYQTSI